MNRICQKNFLKFMMLLLFASLFFAVSGSIETYATNPTIKINVDGKAVNPDVPPYVENQRTLVPARAIFEATKSKVDWDGKSGITITSSSSVIKLTIGKKAALVNGETKYMDVPAKVLNNRTFIPLRFVSEQLKYKVTWDQNSYTVFISSQAVAPPAASGEITSVSVIPAPNEKPNSIAVKITANLPLSNIKPINLKNPERWYVDFKNFKLGSAVIQNQNFNDSRFPLTHLHIAQPQSNTTRVTARYSKSGLFESVLSADKKTCTFYISSNSSGSDQKPGDKPSNGSGNNNNPGTSNETNPNRTLNVPYNPMEDGKYVVMLDPGHGKDTPGKRSFDQSFFEYEFNRDMSKRIGNYLRAKGIQVKETVTADLHDTPLSERVAISNKSDADLFVSIHSNAFGNTWNNARGWEIYCYKKNSHGGRLAKAIHDANIPEVGLLDRGIKETNSPGLYVIRNATKPAVLIEHGFFSNIEELKKLKDPAFRDKMARLDAKGICNFLGIAW